jgi:hypothetical protein
MAKMKSRIIGLARPTATCRSIVDGLQIYGGGPDQQNLTIKDSVFGPLLAQDIYPSDTNTSFDNVSISNVLNINPLLHPILAEAIGSNTGPTPGNWTISNITNYLTPGVNTGEPSHGMEVWGSGHSMTNSILYYGYFQYPPSFTGTNSGNIYFGGEAPPASTNTNPNFVGPLPSNNSPSYATLAAADFTPQCGSCSGKGSSLHKVQDVLDLIDSLNGGAVTKPGDINHDGSVNVIDLSILLSNYNMTTASCDLNSDGTVNIFDLSILLSNYGT